MTNRRLVDSAAVPQPWPSHQTLRLARQAGPCQSHRCEENIKLKCYYPIRNYEYKISEKVFGNRSEHLKETYWELRDPLKIKTVVKTSYKYCPSCAALERTKLDHADLLRWYERYLWSSKYTYLYTRGECEDLIFEPLERWYETGGEEGSSHFTRGDAYWYYRKPKKYISREEARCLKI